MNLVDACIAANHHAELKAAAALWQSLRVVGRMTDGDDGQLELRNCDRCRTTLAMPVQP